MNNTHILSFVNLQTPREIKENLICSPNIQQQIDEYRKTIKDIINHKDNRKIVIVGPCSIHNVESALEYAKSVKEWIEKYQNLFIIMRVYFEKPRTTIGWKGFINDPDLNGNCNINKGLFLARKLMFDISNMGIPIACEFLDVFTPQYMADLVSWGAIGARTVESQLHRQLASGLSMPIGMKNPTRGFPEIAIESMISASYPHNFIGIDDNGKVCLVNTQGNPEVHLILRGAVDKTNYDIESVSYCNELLLKNNLQNSIIIDCSHDNSRKDYRNQENVVKEVVSYWKDERYGVIGMMIESNIMEGKQKVEKELVYGQSITDGCVGLKKTEELLELLNI